MDLLILIFAVLPLVRTYTDYSPYEQPYDIDSELYDNFTSNPEHICARNCDGKPKICYYRFNVEVYSTMGPACKKCPSIISDCDASQCIAADGHLKSITVVNRRYPGPSIQVCHNDTVIIDVTNNLIGKDLTIHWHGILQKDTPWMDGVSMVTQCPIINGQTFRYHFNADSPGTNYWHDHAGLTKVDGVQSSFIVKEIYDGYNNMDQYDFDLPSHTMFISDWLHYISDEDMPIVKITPYYKMVDNFLINGKGVYIGATNGTMSPLKHYSEASIKTPLYKTTVKKGYRYRFRVVSGTCMDCGVRLSIDSHKLLVIATDGNPIKPISVDYIQMFPGERCDFVLFADQEVNLYWITVQGLGVMGKCDVTYQMGILHYEGSNKSLPTYDTLHFPSNPVIYNSIDGDCTGESNICISQSESTAQPPAEIFEYRNNVREFLQLGFYSYNHSSLFQNDHHFPFFVPFTGQQIKGNINNVTFVTPPSPLLTQPNDIPDHLYCSSLCKTHKHPYECMCLDPIKIPLHSVVDIIATDTNPETGLNHPIHIHGLDAYVLEIGSMGPNYDEKMYNLTERLKNGQFKVNRPTKKDTIVIPVNGYVVLRLVADNPGVWFVHCHILYHHALGMNTYIQVGEVEDYPTPPKGFPQCGSFYGS